MLHELTPTDTVLYQHVAESMHKIDRTCIIIVNSNLLYTVYMHMIMVVSFTCICLSRQCIKCPLKVMIM